MTFDSFTSDVFTARSTTDDDDAFDDDDTPTRASVARARLGEAKDARATRDAVARGVVIDAHATHAEARSWTDDDAGVWRAGARTLIELKEKTVRFAGDANAPYALPDFQGLRTGSNIDMRTMRRIIMTQHAHLRVLFWYSLAFFNSTWPCWT